MDGHTEIAIAIALITFIINIIVLSIGGTWKLSKAKDEIYKEINGRANSVGEDVQVLRHEVGETITALKQKINDNDIYLRDHFVRRESFRLVADGLRVQIEAAVKRLEAQIDRLSDKIDRRYDRVGGAAE